MPSETDGGCDTSVLHAPAVGWITFYKTRTPRCCQFSEDRQEPSAGMMGGQSPHRAAALRTSSVTSRGPKMGATRRAEFFGASWKGGTHSSHGRRSSVTVPIGDAPSKAELTPSPCQRSIGNSFASFSLMRLCSQKVSPFLLTSCVEASSRAAPACPKCPR
jgi:hypothetical protein